MLINLLKKAVADTLEMSDFVDPEATLGTIPTACFYNYKFYNNVNLYFQTILTAFLYWIVAEAVIHAAGHLSGPVGSALATIATIISTIIALVSLGVAIGTLIFWGVSSNVDLYAYYVCAGGHYSNHWGGSTWDIEISERSYLYDNDGYPSGKRVAQVLEIDGITQWGVTIPYHASIHWTTW